LVEVKDFLHDFLKPIEGYIKFTNNLFKKQFIVFVSNMIYNF